MQKVNIFWFRRDLRLQDNAGLFHALKSSKKVVPLFIFDKSILDALKDRSDARVTFLHDTISDLKSQLEGQGSSLVVRYGHPLEVFPDLIQEFDIDHVFTNRDYEPYAKERDTAVRELLAQHQIGFQDFKDHVIFDRDEVVKGDGTPYVVFTPYSRTWRSKLEEHMVGHGDERHSYYFQSYPNEEYAANYFDSAPLPLISLEEMDFTRSSIPIPSATVTRKIIREYDEKRDYPAMDATSRLGIHFRFGTISIREKARHAQRLNATYLTELIWRDFYSQILHHFPHVAEEPFRKKYDFIPWRNNEAEYEAWKKGETGYPIVDAGMRQLNETGYMHNRVRMIVASFLTKHLLIDWRWGEAYFAEKLLDFDLASNNGGWQWAAGCGTDAAPYFRIFNPESQMKKFDGKKDYVRHWVPEFGTHDYPAPIVDHKMARQRCLDAYKASLAHADEVLV